jgi:hypothetical protein
VAEEKWAMADGDKFPDDHSGRTSEVVERRSVGDDSQNALVCEPVWINNAGEVFAASEM